MPTIEDSIIEEVKNYPSIYKSPNADNRVHFAAIANKIGQPKISGPIVKVLWNQIVSEYIRNLNLEQMNLDRDVSDLTYPVINTFWMSRLDFLRPFVFNPIGQISSTLDLSKTSDVVKKMSQESDVQWVEEHDSKAEDEVIETMDLDPEIVQDIDKLANDCMIKLYESQFENLFEKIEDKDRLSCYLEVVEALKKL